MSAVALPRLLSRQEAADFLGVKKSTLENWITTGRYHLPVVKVGRLAKYRVADLEKFVAERTVDSGVANS
jgi:excisionase family DNA binding protein